MPVIVISGKPGCGSSTTAKLLAKKLRLAHFSLGDYNKAHARNAKDETDKSLEMWKLPPKRLREFHIKSDRYAVDVAKRGNVVIDAKLGLRMIKGHYDLVVWLTAPRTVRAKRYAKRGNTSFSDGMRKVIEKDTLERSSWKRIYGFDSFSQSKDADLIINTGNKTPEEIVNVILSRIRRVFIVHRWEATPRSDWYRHAKEQLEMRGFAVNILRMPSTKKPTLKTWLPHLSRAIGKPDENTFLIGHSAGVATILHYLENIENRVGGCVLAAGWIDDLGYRQLSSFVAKPFNWKKIRQRCKKFVVIDSDNDPYVKLYHGAAFQKNLKAKRITERGKGHLDDDSRTKKLQSVVDVIEEMTN